MTPGHVHRCAVVLVAAAVAITGCTTARAGAPSSERATAAAAETAPAIIRAALDTTAAGWNRGHLPTYLSVYTPDATEMRSTGPAGGVEAIEQTMRGGFWKTGRPLQHLEYRSVVVRMMGADGALATGQFVLTGGGLPERSGWFTSVWKRTPDGWRMIHDHS